MVTAYTNLFGRVLVEVERGERFLRRAASVARSRLKRPALPDRTDT
jgi:hypothetical protein